MGMCLFVGWRKEKKIKERFFKFKNKKVSVIGD